HVVLGLKIMQIVSAFGGFIVPAAVFSLLVSSNRLEYLHANKLGKISTLILGGLLMWCAFPLINYMGELNSRLQLPASMHDIQTWMKAKEDEAGALTNAFMDHQTIKGLLLNLFMVGFLAAVAEELFFRATLQQLIIKATGNIHVGVWVTGILFSAIHFEFFGFFPRMLMGVYLGYLFVWSKSVWVPIFAHFVNNATVVFLMYLEDKNMLPKKVDELGTNSSQIGYVIVSMVIVAVLMLVIYRIESKGKVALPDN
ncbi:MAG TPA: CPBP family intramembrane glutamic endopeptidase, partial [Bacteroidia bacterium]|nr:CPBP family intramembrane glutamic endopeptidase [Bacteroidia bacterium]